MKQSKIERQAEIRKMIEQKFKKEKEELTKNVKKQSQNINKNVSNKKNAKTKRVKTSKKSKSNKKDLLDKLIDFSLKKVYKHEAPKNTNDSIPFIKMHRDGICHVEKDVYDKVVIFEDTNYQLAKEEVQFEILNKYMQFLNFFDENTPFKLTFINSTVNKDDFSINIENKDDNFNDIREEYQEMLLNQMSKGNNGIVKKKYITFSTTAKNYSLAKISLERIEREVKNNFKTLDVKCESLNGSERLELLRDIYYNDNYNKFIWNDDGALQKDYVAPEYISHNRNYFRCNDNNYSVKYFQVTANELEDKTLSDLLDLDKDMIVTFCISPIEQLKAMKMVKKKHSDVNTMIIEEQKKAVRAGYDMSILPPDLDQARTDVDELYKQLQSRNEKLFAIDIVVVNANKNIRVLNTIDDEVKGIAQKRSCEITKLLHEQEQGFNTALPLSVKQIDKERILNTSTLSIFVPFTTQELYSKGKSLYYGLNALSNNIIMCDRKELKTPNGLFLGTPGSGKSFTAKREMANAFLVTDDDILICDPEGEYSPLVHKLDGQVVKISQNSKTYINPFDMSTEFDEVDEEISVKANFVLSLCEIMVGGMLTAKEKSIIDRGVRHIYRDWRINPVIDNVPVLEDLYNFLLEQEDYDAQQLATTLEIYVLGSLNVFNNRTNININNRVVCFDIKELQSQLKKLGMLAVQEQVWSRVTKNRNKKSTRYYIDEFHLLLQDEQTATYSVEIWKRFRKWGGIPTGITQNVKDFLQSLMAENILDNSEFIIMLNQNGGDRVLLAKHLNISDSQLSYVTNADRGCGLLFFGNAIIPFVDRFPKDTTLYKLMTTKPEDLIEKEVVGV